MTSESRFRRGDHLQVRRRNLYWHHGVYVRDDRVIEFLPGDNHAWFAEPEPMATHVERFLTGIWERGPASRAAGPRPVPTGRK